MAIKAPRGSQTGSSIRINDGKGSGGGFTRKPEGVTGGMKGKDMSAFFPKVASVPSGRK